MNHRQAKFWVWWLLPVLAARSLVPVGFMADVQHGFRLVICSGIVALRSSVADQQASLHHAGGATDSRQSVAHVLCPFAASGGAALAVAVPIIASACQHGAITVATGTNVVIVNRHYVAHAIRGPPAFS